MEEVKNISLAKMVIMKPSAAAVLERHHLDFCCKGKQTLADALADDKELLEKVNKELEEIFSAKNENASTNFENYSLTELVNHILNKHHKYVKEILPVLYEHTQKVASKHGERHPELVKIAELFAEIKRDFEQHIMKEEGILFPRIKIIDEVSQGLRNKTELNSIDGPVQVMIFEHENAGKLMEEIRILSDNYMSPEGACTTYRVSFLELQEFELDLHQHVHLENNILFPKALEKLQILVGG
jgi:regulator of cell morphogenesis and NO signaling